MANSTDKTERKKVMPEDKLTWKDIEVGAIATEPGSACQYETGDWRSRRPNYSNRDCIKCGICQIYCPEGCVKQDQEGFFEPDMYYCKGCGICAKECPKKTITMTEEKE